MYPHRLPRRHGIRAILTLLVLGPMGPGCAPAPMETGESSTATVNVTTGSPASSSHQQGVASPVAEAILTAISEAGTQTLRASLGSRNRVANFQVTVPAGPVTFHTEVVSNTGVTLYEGTEEVTVDGDGFQVEIELEARAPILLATPDSIRWAPGAQFSFRLSNVGTDRVQWRVEGVSPCPTHRCLETSPPSGAIESFTQSTDFEVYLLDAPPQLYTILLHTDQGMVEILFDATPVQDQPEP